MYPSIGCLIIVLNARFDFLEQSNNSATDISSLKDIFIPVFFYTPPSISDSYSISDIKKDRELLVYHEFKSNWYIAEKLVSSNSNTVSGLAAGIKSMLGVGAGDSSFQTLLESPTRPTASQLVDVLKAAMN